MTWNDVYEYENGNLYAKSSVNPKYPKGRKVGYVDHRGYVRTKLGYKNDITPTELYGKCLTELYQKARRLTI